MYANYGVDLTQVATPTTKKKSSSSSRRSGGYYISMRDGVVVRHDTWESCKARVHGTPAKFKKVFDPAEEQAVLHSWGMR